MHRKVEDVIRSHSFTTAYGLAHKNLSELTDDNNEDDELPF